MPRRPLRTIPALFLLVTNSACPGADGASTGPSPAIPECPVPVCRYQGTSWAEDLIGDELLDRGEASVVWRFSHMVGREAVYVPAGSVSATWRTEQCAITLAPSGATFNSAAPEVRHARLHVDFSVRPVRYSGVGSSSWAGTQTWSCRGDTPFTGDGVSTTWFSVTEATSDDPGLLRGSVSTGTTRSVWEFVNAP